jgi:hypothetical protein
MMPGWNSLTSVSRIQWWMEIAGFVFLGLCVVSEVIAFFYGNRKDALSEQATTEQIESIKAAQRQRRLSDEQKRTLIAALSPYQGQKISVVRIMGDTEAEPPANDFVDVLVAAGWVFDGKPGVVQAAYDRDPIGIEPTLNQVEAKAGRIPPALPVLVDTLLQLNLIRERKGFANLNVPIGRIELRVGRRP